MGEKSQIQWTEATYNPWHGCKKVSAGCKFCYMFRDKIKFGQDPTKVVRSKGTFYDPLKWKEPRLIFTCSWSDWFIDEADQWREEAWQVIKKTPWHTYQILTKRPERILSHLPPDWGDGYPNVWIGVSVEDEDAAALRIPLLLKVPAAVRFLSCEPLLGMVDFYKVSARWPSDLNHPWRNEPILYGIDWVIVGGESGNDKGAYTFRPCNLLWIKTIVDNCQDGGVPVFVKQLGTYLSKQFEMKDRHGGNIEEFPFALQVREMPYIQTKKTV